jgi:hypothetical protein
MTEWEQLPMAEADAFSQWIAQRPYSYVASVWNAMQVYQRTCDSTALQDLVACRDAQQQLLMAAQEGGFPGLESLFYQGYVTCCQLLLCYVNL